MEGMARTVALRGDGFAGFKRQPGRPEWLSSVGEGAVAGTEEERRRRLGWLRNSEAS